MSHINIAQTVFFALLATRSNGKIPVRMRPHSIIGTVQDDPFDEWFCAVLASSIPEFEIIHSGSLTTPDVIVRDRSTREIIGIEVKKIEQTPSGRDSRGLTLDYNSCIPCGHMQIKIGGTPSLIKTYYFFGLLSVDQSHLVSSCLMDGDFLNYDFKLHLNGKYLNTSQYGHGPYGEGSVRGRAMYNYPNPLNTDIQTFFNKNSLVVKQEFAYQLAGAPLSHAAIINRTDINNTTHVYYQYTDTPSTSPSIVNDVFARCKARMIRNRTPYMTDISEMPAPYMPQQNDYLF